MNPKTLIRLGFALASLANVSQASIWPQPVQLGVAKAGSTPQKSFRLFSPAGPTDANAALVGDIIYVHVRFTNTSVKPIDFGPEFVSMSDSRNVLLRSISPIEVVETYQAIAASLQIQANQAVHEARQAYHDQRENDRNLGDLNLQNDDGSRNKTLTALAATSVIFSAIGTISQDAEARNRQMAATTAQEESAAIVQKIRSTTLQSQRLPPGVSTEGWVYFAEPPSWPVTLRVLTQDQVVSTNLTKVAEIPLK